jgi:hypothetical protein
MLSNKKKAIKSSRIANDQPNLLIEILDFST